MEPNTPTPNPPEAAHDMETMIAAELHRRTTGPRGHYWVQNLTDEALLLAAHLTTTGNWPAPPTPPPEQGPDSPPMKTAPPTTPPPAPARNGGYNQAALTAAYHQAAHEAETNPATGRPYLPSYTALTRALMDHHGYTRTRAQRELQAAAGQLFQTRPEQAVSRADGWALTTQPPPEPEH